jgi:hypothetical protein
MTIKSGQTVTVIQGYHIPMIDHLISADESEEKEIANSWLNWTLSLSQLFNHEDNEQLTTMIIDLRKHINGDFDTSQLLKRLDTVQKPFSADHWHFSLPAAMFGVAILIAVVSFVIWKKCCAQAPSTAHTPTPLPAPQPLPQIQSQPQPQVQMPPPQILPHTAPPAYTQQNPMFNFSKPMAPVLIYT